LAKSGYIDRERDGRRTTTASEPTWRSGYSIKRNVDIASLLDGLVARDDARGT